MAVDSPSLSARACPYNDSWRSAYSISCLVLSLLAAASLGIQKQARHNTLLKVLSIMMSLLTLLLMATAWSKMALYISVYGLSVKRLLPCVFMVFLAVVYLGVIALQKRSFSIVRLATVTGAILFCLLSSAIQTALWLDITLTAT